MRRDRRRGLRPLPAGPEEAGPTGAPGAALHRRALCRPRVRAPGGLCGAGRGLLSARSREGWAPPPGSRSRPPLAIMQLYPCPRPAGVVATLPSCPGAHGERFICTRITNSSVSQWHGEAGGGCWLLREEDPQFLLGRAGSCVITSACTCPYVCGHTVPAVAPGAPVVKGPSPSTLCHSHIPGSLRHVAS